MDYILVIPAGHSPVLAQAVDAWRVAPVEVAHNPNEMRSITEEKGEPRLIVVSATMPNLVPNVAAMRKTFPHAKVIVAGSLTPQQLREIQADDVVRFPFPVGVSPGRRDHVVADAGRQGGGRHEPEKPMGKDRVVLVTSRQGRRREDDGGDAACDLAGEAEGAGGGHRRGLRRGTRTSGSECRTPRNPSPRLNAIRRSIGRHSRGSRLEKRREGVPPRAGH